MSRFSDFCNKYIVQIEGDGENSRNLRQSFQLLIEHGLDPVQGYIALSTQVHCRI